MCHLQGFGRAERIAVDTPYGQPSASVSKFQLRDCTLLFIPRHGYQHTLAPHRIPYQANLSALRQLGAQHVIGTCIVGSVRRAIKPGHVVIPDQFINLTWGRDCHPADDQNFQHTPMATPYCDYLRRAIGAEVERLGYPVHHRATTLVIQGPRFSTEAEGRMFANWGADIINMTQYPEVLCARDLGICYALMATVTDWESFLGSCQDLRNGPTRDVLQTFRQNIRRTHRIIQNLLTSPDQLTGCRCANQIGRPYYRTIKQA